MSYVLFGQLCDPNIKALQPYFDVFVDQASRLQWDLEWDQLSVDREPLVMTGFFGRADVFGQNTQQKYSNFYVMRNYLEAHPTISRHNHRYHRETPYKLFNVMMARRVGLQIPKTVAGMAMECEDCIVKPVAGGAHAVAGNQAIHTAIIQERLTGPNRRLFIVGDKHFGFELRTDKLDYRDDPQVEVVPYVFDEDIVKRTRVLTELLGLTFSASDFMGDVYLETNAGPMFARFDQVVGGELARAIRGSL